MSAWAPGALAPQPGAAPRTAMWAAQARTELTLLLRNGEQVLLSLVLPVGLLVVLAGWNGAANTSNLYEQIPYAISGGLFGLGLVFIGSFLYFAHWITELVKEHRAQSASIVEAISRLEHVLLTSSGPTVDAASTVVETSAITTSNGVVLVATEKGTMAHRPECVIVAGKMGLRPVSPAEGLAPCKLCDPYAVAAN